MATEVLEPAAAVAETEQPAEVPASPEATAEASPAPPVEGVPAGQEPAASTRSRGPDGRFIKADGTQATVEEHAAIEAAAPTAPAPPTPAPTYSGDAFTFRADGGRHPVPGAVLSADGWLHIPPDQVPNTRQLWSEGVTHRGTWRQQKAEWESRVQNAGTVEKARADKYHNAAVRMFDALTNADWLAAATSDPREVQHFIRELQLQLKEADLGQPRPVEAAPKGDPQAERQQLESAASQTLAEYMEELLETPQARAVYDTPEKRRAVQDRYNRRMGAYFVDQDGEIALHENAVDADFHDELALQQEARKAAKSFTKAAEFNARRNQPAVTAPPVVSTKGPGGSGAGGAKRYTTREEYNKAMGLH